MQTFQVPVKEGLIDREQRGRARKAHRKGREMSLQTGIDFKGACSIVHAGDVLHLSDIFGDDLLL